MAQRNEEQRTPRASATRADTTKQAAPRTRDAVGRRPSAGRTSAPPQIHTALLAGEQIPYTVRVSQRARNLRLVIRPATGLEVVLPRGANSARVEQVLQEKAQWIVATLRRVAREAVEAAPPPLETGRTLPFAGRQVQMVLRTGAPTGRFRAALVGDILTLTVADASQEVARAALEHWYRRQAHEVFAERLAHWNAHYGYSYGRVSIKEQKSRWGSCSRQGNLNFNWRLLLAPLPVLDYVVVHELCHLRELNHSPRFWALVARTCPDYLAQRRWLRQHGHELRF